MRVQRVSGPLLFFLEQGNMSAIDVGSLTDGPFPGELHDELVEEEDDEPEDAPETLPPPACPFRDTLERLDFESAVISDIGIAWTSI